MKCLSSSIVPVFSTLTMSFHYLWLWIESHCSYEMCCYTAGSGYNKLGGRGTCGEGKARKTSTTWIPGETRVSHWPCYDHYLCFNGLFSWLIMCGPRKLGHKNGSSPFPGWTLYSATKPRFSFMFIFCRVFFGFTDACHISVRFGLFLTMLSDELGRHKMGHSIQPGHHHWHLRLRHDLGMPIPNRRWPSQKRSKSKHNRRFV